MGERLPVPIIAFFDDCKRYWPVGLTIYRSHESGARIRQDPQRVQVGIMAIDMRKYGVSIDDVKKTLRACGGAMTVKVFNTWADLIDVLNYFKRFSVTLFDSDLKVTSVESEQELAIEDQE